MIVADTREAGRGRLRAPALARIVYARELKHNPAKPFDLRGGLAEDRDRCDGGAVSADDGLAYSLRGAIVGNLSTPCGCHLTRSVVGRAAHPGSSHLPTHQSQMRHIEHTRRIGRPRYPQPFRLSAGRQFSEQPRYSCIKRFYHSHASESGRVCQDIPARCQPRQTQWPRNTRKCPKSKGNCLGFIRKENT